MRAENFSFQTRGFGQNPWLPDLHAQAGKVFDNMDANLRGLAEQVRNFNRSSTSMECASLRENLLGARRSIVPYDEDKLTPELQEQRRGLVSQLDALSLQLTARTNALEGISPSVPHITLVD